MLCYVTLIAWRYNWQND